MTVLTSTTPMFRRMSLPVVLLALAISIFVGLSRQGDVVQDPRYPDRGDAYSEQIVRNTVINAFLGTENRDGSLIWTRGYPEDISFSPVETRRYHSQLGLQAALYKAAARLLPNPTEKKLSMMFDGFRLLNCLLLVSIIFIFFKAILPNERAALLATMTMSLSSGLAIFGANLYWQYWLMFAPLLAVPVLLAGRSRLYLLMALVFGLLHFFVRYEFATTFALMWLLPVILASGRGLKRPVLVGAGGFAAVCTAFVIAIALHHYRVALVEGVSLREASRFVFENAGLRMASLENVPFPGSVAFFKNIAFRLSEDGFAFEDLFSLSRASVLFLVALIYAMSPDRQHLLILIWAIVTYGSWYVFGYQHIMQHFKFDTMLFSATLGLVFVYQVFGRVKIGIGPVAR